MGALAPEFGVQLESGSYGPSQTALGRNNDGNGSYVLFPINRIQHMPIAIDISINLILHGPICNPGL